MSFFRQKTEEPRASRAAPSPAGSKIETVIGPNCYLQGTIQSDGGIRIDGVFQGDLETTGNLIIGESAKVVAEIEAHNVSVAGAVKGNISGNKVEILETGRVEAPPRSMVMAYIGERSSACPVPTESTTKAVVQTSVRVYSARSERPARQTPVRATGTVRWSRRPSEPTTGPRRIAAR